MVDRPILFSGAMVKALLDGRKTQTRRILQVDPSWHLDPCRQDAAEAGHCWFTNDTAMPGNIHLALRFAKGDRLWVRETWARTSVAPIASTIDSPIVVYRESDNRTDYGGPWKPGIHMPRAASRLTLTVTDVRVQRLQDIDIRDCRAEGCEIREFSLFGTDAKGGDEIGRIHYRMIWEAINGAGSWDVNPWIVAVTFTVERRNIDG